MKHRGSWRAAHSLPNTSGLHLHLEVSEVKEAGGADEEGRLLGEIRSPGTPVSMSRQSPDGTAVSTDLRERVSTSVAITPSP